MPDPLAKLDAASREDEHMSRSRMSFGDHLEELRRRVLFALAGLVVTTVVCMVYGDHIIATLTAPYQVSMTEAGFNPRLVQLNPLESFVEYFKICLEFGLVLAAPWVIYQLWRFVETGLFPHERRVIRYFAPASIGLFCVGAGFMVAIVLTRLMTFLISMSAWFPLPTPEGNWLAHALTKEAPITVADSRPADDAPLIPVLSGDPDSPKPGQIWVNLKSRQLRTFADGQKYGVLLERVSDTQFVQPFFSISEYLGFVVNLALAFGLGFQIPIAVVFLIAVGILRAARLAAMRKFIVVGVFVLAAILTPTPDVGTMLLLAVPMIVLFELGLLIGRFIERRRATTPQ